MIKARMAKEAIVRIENRIGALALVTRNIADKGLCIEAVIATLEGTDAVIRMVGDDHDHQRIIDALREQGLQVQEAKVVTAEIEHRPGLLRQITEKLAQQNIDLLYLYGTAAPGDKCLIVLSSTNNDWAIKVLNG